MSCALDELLELTDIADDAMDWMFGLLFICSGELFTLCADSGTGELCTLCGKTVAWGVGAAPVGYRYPRMVSLGGLPELDADCSASSPLGTVRGLAEP